MVLERRWAILLVLVLVLVFVNPAFSAETGSICLAPVVDQNPPLTFVPPGAPCDAAKLSVRIDTQRSVAWPVNGNVNMGDLDASVTHRVVILCNGKSQQSFRFRFADFETRKLCLFINDLYKTVQLWDSKRTPWCRCR
jgi:hypothetical protein